MTLVSDIILDAFRESNLISITATPTTAEQTEALRLLNRVVLASIGDDAGEQLDILPIGRNNISRPVGYPYYDQVPFQTDWFVPPNTRLMLNLSTPQTVYLNPSPTDGERFGFVDKSANLNTNPLTVVGNGMTIDGLLSEVFNVASAKMEFVYREDTGNWAVLTPLTLASDMPFPADYDDVFIIELAMRLNPRNATDVDPQSLQAYRKALRGFKAKYRQHRQVGSEAGITRLPSNRRRRVYDNNIALARFNSGWAGLWGDHY
jgi:hypothetical protein